MHQIPGHAISYPVLFPGSINHTSAGTNINHTVGCLDGSKVKSIIHDFQHDLVVDVHSVGISPSDPIPPVSENSPILLHLVCREDVSVLAVVCVITTTILRTD